MLLRLLLLPAFVALAASVGAADATLRTACPAASAAMALGSHCPVSAHSASAEVRPLSITGVAAVLLLLSALVRFQLSKIRSIRVTCSET